MSLCNVVEIFQSRKNEFISQIWNDLYIVSLYINEDWNRKNGNIHKSLKIAEIMISTLQKLPVLVF